MCGAQVLKLRDGYIADLETKCWQNGDQGGPRNASALKEALW